MELQLPPPEDFCNGLSIQDNECLVFVFSSDVFEAIEGDLKKLLLHCSWVKKSAAGVITQHKRTNRNCCTQ